MSKQDDAYLFFSVDIQNSTEFKYNSIINGKTVEEKNKWKEPFIELLGKFEGIFKDSAKSQEKNLREALKNLENGPNAEMPKIVKWKTVGDEVLFYASIDTWYDQVLFLVFTFKESIMRFNKDTLQNYVVSGNKKLQLKGTVWFANIPANDVNMTLEIAYENSKSVPEKDGEEFYVKDFIGTTIDIGFRIAKLATEEKLVISAETAILLIRDNYLTLEDNSMSIYFDGTRDLKGLHLENDYPLLWIDMADYNILNKVSKIEREIKKTCYSNIVRYIHEYIKLNNQIMKYPFIPADRLFGNWNDRRNIEI